MRNLTDDEFHGRVVSGASRVEANIRQFYSDSDVLHAIVMPRLAIGEAVGECKIVGCTRLET